MRPRLVTPALVASAALAAFWLLRPSGKTPPSPAPAQVSASVRASAPLEITRVPESTISRADEPAPTAPVTAMTRFDSWSQKFLAAPAEERPALVAEGRALAEARRPEFLDLIARDPRGALQAAVSPLVRQELPAEILERLEERVNARGALVTYLSRPVEGAVQPPTIRYAKLADGRELQAHTFGRDEFLVAEQPERSLIGVALADAKGKAQLALSDSPLRRLEAGERPNPALEPIRACPVSGKSIALPANEAPAVITDATPAVEANGQIIYLCDGSHTTVYEEQLLYAQGSAGGPQRVTGNFPHSPGKSVGVLRLIYVPLTFLDQNAAPASEATSYDVMRQVADYYQKQSFGKITVQTTVTPPVRLPHTEAWYIAKDAEVDGLGLEHSHAMSEARKLGYDSNDYDCLVVRLNGGPRATGGWGGGNRIWTYFDDVGIIAHEMGHTFGLAHANFWNTNGVSAIGGGASQEYGDQWDVMGGGGGTNGHYNIWAKGNVSWLPAAQLWDVKQSGTYRIFSHDANTLEPARRYGLKVTKDTARTYYVEARQLRDSDANKVWLKYGAVIEWRWSAKGGNNLLLDTTPGSLFGKDDGTLTLGRTFSDREAGIHFTPVAVNFGPQKSIDLVVNVGNFAGNTAPTLALSAATMNVAVNTPVTIDATAFDADGDALAYFWETSDRQVYANSAQFTRTFATAGMYWVACTVSDMKGGATLRYAIVNVGTHSQFSIGGRITRSGVGMPGVLVKTSARQAYTDADGFYTVAGLASGAQTLTVAQEGYAFTGATAFTLGPNVTNADFVATDGTLLSIAASSPAAAEGGANGRFTLTRTGDTSAALTVIVQTISGRATKATDYSIAPDVVSNAFTIPAGQASLDIDVTPVDDTSAEGPETVTLQLVPDAAYAITGLGEATVTIADNDTTLPLISIAASLAHTVENDPAPARFTITRTGSTGAALVVNLAVSGTATNGVDFTTVPATVTIPADAPSVTVPISTLNDSLNEGSETVTLTLSTSAAYLIATNTASVTIVDDDQQIISVTAADASASETAAGSPNPGVFLITRTGDTAQPLTVFYAMAGTALHGVDFETLPGSVTIPAGQSSAAVTVLPITDGLGEGAETVQVLLASLGSQYQLASTSTATVTIADDPADVPTIEVHARDGFVVESGDAGRFRLTARGGDGSAFNVNYTVSGTAVNGVDFATLSGTATIPAGTGTRTVDVSITPLQDAVAEPIETVTLTLASGAAYSSWAQTSTATIWLRDDEAPTVFADIHREVPAEGGASSSFYLSRVGATTGALDVNFTLSGTATNGVDYAAIPLTATIPDGASGVDVPVTPVNDTLAEGTETIILTLAPGAYSASPVAAVHYLTDNETPSASVQFSVANDSAQEDAGTVNIPVTLTGGISAPATVEYYLSSGTNTSVSTSAARVSFPYWVRLVRAGDIVTAFRSANGSTWTQQGTPQQLAMGNPVLVGLAVCSVNDGTLATGVFDNVTVVGGNNSWLSQDIGNASAVGSYTLAGSTFTVRGSGSDIFGGTDEFRYVYQTLAGDGSITARVVSLTNTANSAKAGVMIREDISNFSRHALMALQADADPELIVRASGRDTAFGAGVDFDLGGGPVGTLTFNPGDTTQNIPLTIINDALREFGERVIIKLRNANGVAIGARSEFVFSIGDDDGGLDVPEYVGFVRATDSALESAGTVTLPVALTRASNAPVTVNFAVSGGTATDPGDFTLANGTLTFAAGETVKNLLVPIADDALTEANETFSVTLSSPSGAALSNAANTTFTILNDDGEPTITIVKPTTNTANIPSAVGLILQATTDHLGEGAVVAWSKVSGPGTVTFGAAALESTAQFSTPGTYVLRVTATNGALSASDEVKVNAGFVEHAFTTEAVGTLPTAATGQFVGGSWTVDAGGSGIPSNAAADNFGFLDLPMTGNVQITARVVSVQAVDGSNSRAGVMIRDSLAGGALEAFVGITSAPAGRFIWRNTAGANSANATATTTLPYWVRLTRTGNSFAAQVAPDSGGNPGAFVNVGTSQTIAMSGTALVGLAATSGSSTQSGTAVFDRVTITPAATNVGPAVNAGPNATVTSTTANLNGTVTDDALPNPPAATARLWSLVSGPGDATFGNESAAATTATFSSNGLYTLRLTADDGAIATFDDVALTIELPAVSVIASDASAGEWAGNAGAFTVSRTGSTSGALVVNFSVAGTANEGADFASIGTSVIIPNGAASAVVPIAPVLDSLSEGPETVSLTLAAATSYVIASPDPVEVLIEDRPLDAWRFAEFGLDAGNPEIAGDLADPDGDGVKNLAEYAQRLDPAEASAAPVFGREPGFLTLTYRRNLAAVDVTFTIQETLTLSGANVWTNATVVEEIVSDDGTTRVIKAKVATGAEPGHFLRLRVTRN